MAGTLSGVITPAFTINPSLSKAVTAATPVDVSGIGQVCFDVAVNLTIGAAQAFPLEAREPMQIDTSVSSITVDVDAYMWANQR